MIVINRPTTVQMPMANPMIRSAVASGLMPYGDPHRGAPFGEKNGPAIGLVGAFSAISAGLATTGFLGGLLIAGGVLGGIGALTGNKTLTAIGSVAGLAGGFISPEGAFMNPFAEGAGQSSLGAGYDKVFGSVKEAFGLGGNTAAESIISNATPNINPAGLTSAANISNNAGNAAGGLIKAAEIGEAAAGGGNSVLKTLSDSSGLLGAISGGADAYLEAPLQEAQVERLESATDAQDYGVDLQKQRQANLQNQNVNLPTANEAANVHADADAQGSTGGRYAVVVDGQVKYVTQPELDAIRQQGQGGNAGLINQGGAANG